MSAVSILESVVMDIQNLIKTGIEANLADVRTLHSDAVVTTEKPASYFTYPDAIGYKAPAIFTVADRVDFRLANGQNHINAQVSVYVSCLVEDRAADKLQIKIWRYHDALFKLLNRSVVVSPDGKIRNQIKVVSTELSGTERKKSSHDSIFRKEIMLTLNVEHYQNEN